MTFAELFCLAAGGGLGALCRYAVTTACARHVRRFPLGTLLVNVLGSTLMGLLAGWGTQGGAGASLPLLFAGAGFLGALTTFSTFAMDTFATFRDEHPAKAVLNIILNAALSLGGATAGLVVSAS